MDAILLLMLLDQEKKEEIGVVVFEERTDNPIKKRTLSAKRDIFKNYLVATGSVFLWRKDITSSSVIWEKSE